MEMEEVEEVLMDTHLLEEAEDMEVMEDYQGLEVEAAVEDLVEMEETMEEAVVDMVNQLEAEIMVAEVEDIILEEETMAEEVADMEMELNQDDVQVWEQAEPVKVAMQKQLVVEMEYVLSNIIFK